MNACSQNIAAPLGAEGFDIKIYGHYFVAGEMDHKVLFDYYHVAGVNEKEAAMKALALHRKDHPDYRPTCVEVGGCRRTPGGGRIYFFDGENPVKNFEPNQPTV